MKRIFVLAVAVALTLTACTNRNSNEASGNATVVAPEANNVASIIAKAEEGNAAAQLNYARLLRTTGNGVEQDWDKAVEMFQKSAEGGNSDAQWELGLMYENGDHVEKDVAKAIKLYRESSDDDNAIGLYLVGHCYQHGIVVEKDDDFAQLLYSTAVNAMKKVSYQEDKYLLNFLGSAYYWGDGVGVDRELAFDYYFISAKKGNPETQFKIGQCYEKGEGTAKDMAQARSWYQKSADQGYGPAVRALERLAN